MGMLPTVTQPGLPGSGMWSLEVDCLGLNPGSTTSLWPQQSCLVALSQFSHL